MDMLTSKRFDSWKDISAYLGRDVRTVVRWEKEKGLPVHRVPGGKRQAVFAYRHEIDLWLASPQPTSEAAEGLTSSEDPLVADAKPAPAAQYLPTALTAQSISDRIFGKPWKWKMHLVVGLAAILVGAAVVKLYIFPWQYSGPVQLIGLQKLTANGREKKNLVFVGANLYFAQEREGWYTLATMPAQGGPISTLWSPRMNVFPEDADPNGNYLLAFTSLGIERERALWIVPLKGGMPYPLQSLTAHSASLSPDGRTIAYATGNNIYLTSIDGSNPKQIESFTDIPDVLRWSSDGKRLRFLLLDAVTRRPTYWDLSLATSQLRALPLARTDIGEGWSRTTTSDENIVSADDGNDTDLAWIVGHGHFWWEPSVSMKTFRTGLAGNGGVAYDENSNHVFLLSELPVRSVLVQFDPKTGAFRQILPGVSGAFVDYSRDGQWITYTRPDDQTLWLSRVDGSELRQLTDASQGNVELPRWSPDGRSIAYMFKRSDSPWRIFIIRRDGGTSREASEGNDNQGAPTWSPDGKYIVYGNVECESTHNCAIRRIDLQTGRVQSLPGSEGLETARWSPDGRFIAAMQSEQHQIYIFTVSTHQWKKLADGMDGTDLSWSRDSGFIYANVPGNDARIVRIDLTNGQTETTVAMRSQDSLNLANVPTDMGFSVAPDNEIIFRRKISAAEVYTYSLKVR